MYCQNCGKELHSGEQFCSRCGTKAGAARSMPQIRLNAGILEAGRVALPENLDRLGQAKVPYLLGLVLLMAGMLLMDQNMFRVSYSLLGEREQMFSMFAGAEAVKTWFYIAYVAGGLWMLAPMLTGKPWRKSNFYVGIGVSGAAVAWMIGALCVVTGKVKEGYTGDIFTYVKLKLTLSASGWAFLLLSGMTVLVLLEAKLRLLPGADGQSDQ